jgi:hypothetical protein
MICRHRDISLLKDEKSTPSQSNPARWPPRLRLLSTIEKEAKFEGAVHLCTLLTARTWTLGMSLIVGGKESKEEKSVECELVFFLLFQCKSGSFRLACRISRLRHLRIRERNCRIIVIIPAVFSDPSSDTTVGGKLSLHQGKNRRRRKKEMWE